MPRDILIDPQRTGSGNPNIQFSGSAGNTILLEVLSEGSVQFTGVSGSLLRISDFPAAGGPLNSLFLSGTVAITGSFIPGESNGFDLGSSTKKWANIYSTNIIGSLTGSNLTAGQVVVAGTGGLLSGSNNLWWENSTGRVGIGTSSPSVRFHINGSGNEQFWIMGGGSGYLFGGYDQANSRGRIGAYTGASYTSLLLNEGGGNVGIGTTNPSYLLDVNGQIRASALVDLQNTSYLVDPGSTSVLNLVNATGFYDADGGNARRFLNPGGGSLTTSTSSITGALKIRFPASRNNSSTMLFITVKIYEYITGKSVEYRIGGYNYSLGNWYNWFAYNLTDTGTNHAVRFGYDGTSDCIWIGETSTTWAYPQAYITEVLTGYSGFSADWASGWALSWSTSFDTVEQGPYTPNRFWGNNNDGAGSGLDADLLDGYHASSFGLGTGTQNYVAKWTSTGNSLGNSQIFDNGTNVGIGTSTSLTERLHINGNVSLTNIVNGAGSIGITPASGGNVSLNTAGSGVSIISGLYYTTPQSISVTVGTESWIRLATVANLCDLKLHVRITSTNSEEVINASIKGNYYNVNTKIDVDRVTYAERLREIWVDQPTTNGGPKTIYLKIRSTDFAPNLTWWLYDSIAAATTIHNNDVTATPPTSGISLSLSTSLNTQQFSNSNLIISGTNNPKAGIGTNLPGAKLHIHSPSGTEIARFSHETSTGYIGFTYSTSAFAGYLGNGSSLLTGASSTDFVLRSEGNLVLASSGNNRRVTINTSGNVGIGTASPDTNAPLTIDTTLNTHIALRGSGNTQRQAIIASNSGVSSNYNGLALYSNTNASFSQANTSLSSWRTILGNFDITADRFAVSRMAAGGASFSEFLTIVSSGNVGVGTTNPAGLLTVSGTIVTKYNTGLESYIAAGTYSAGTTGFYPVYAAGGSFGSNDTVIKYGAGGNNLVLLHGSTVVLSANSSENVSIGTNSYTGRLFVSGSSVAATPTMVVKEGVSNPTGGAGTFDVQNSAGTSILFVTGSGRVGIGTITPQAAFHVVNGSVPNAANLYIGYVGSNNYYDANQHYYRDGSGNTRLTISSTGNVTPGADATQDLGSSSLRWRNVFAANISGSLTGSNVLAGQVVVAGAGGVLSGSNDFYWNNSNRRVGIGTSSPSYDFQVGSSATVGTRTLALIDSGYGIVIKGGNGNGIVQSLGTTVPLELQAGNGNNGNYYFTSTGNVGIGTATAASKIFVYTTQNNASTTPSFDFHGAFMRIGDYTTSLSFTNGVGIKIHDAGEIHYTLGQLDRKFLISDTSNDGNALFPASRSDIIAISSTNVGIGSTSPGYKLDVNGDLNIASTRIFRVNGTAVMNTQASNGSDIYMNARVVRNESSVNTDGLYLGYGNSGTTTGHIRFFANGTTERMKIAADTGSVIISDLAGSVSTSAARLLISGSSTASTPTMIVREGVVSPTGGAGTFDVQNSAGTSLLFVSGSGTVGIGTINQGARFYVSSSLTGNAASALIIGGQVFGVSLNTFKGHTQLFQLGNGTETMRIDASGNVGIGTGALDSRLVVNGNSVFSGSANPDSDNTRSLGSSTKRWQAIYAATGSISNVVFSPVSTGNTYTTTFATGEAGRLTATKTINLSTATTFFTVSSNNGASMFDVSFVVSESGFSVARKYSVAAQFGSSASNVVTFKTVDTGPYSGSDLTVSFSKTSNTVTTCTVSHNYSPSANIAMTIDISAISSGGSPTMVTIF